MITYPQGIWGDTANPGTPADLLDNNFAAVYAPFFGILEVGIPGTAGFSMRFGGGAQVLAYLPASGPPGPLTMDLLDPTSSASGAFGGEVVALRVNIDFSDAGLTLGSLGIPFGNLTVCDLTNTPLLNGMTVRQVLGTMNTALGGGAQVYPILQLNALAATLSTAFSAGSPNPFAQDHLVIGACPCGPCCEKKLTASDAEANAEFGTSVCLDGDTAVVGAALDDNTGTDSGSAYVYVLSGGVWTFQQKLTPLDPAAGDQFGVSVSVSADTVVVGAHKDDCVVPGLDCGSAYVFTRNGVGTWNQQAKLTASDPAASDFFGYSVSVSGDTILVGAYADDCVVPGLDCGSAYVFVRGANNVWDNGSVDQQGKLTADDAAAIDFFGYSVSVSGDTAVIGAYANDDAGAASGSAYVFVRGANNVWDNGSLDQQAKLTANDPAALALFGRSVSISGDTAVIGSALDDAPAVDSGSAYVFTRSGTVWTQQPKLTALDAAAGDQFGQSVSVSGDAIIVGAYLDDDGGVSSGSAYVFVRSGGVWDQSQKLTASDAAADDNFGASVSVSGNTALVGAYQDDGVGGNSGSAYVFSCTPPANDIVWDPATNPIPWPNINPLATTRSLRFTVTGPAGPSKLEAIRVTMVDLMHPDPRNLTQYAPPSYSTFDTLTHGTCAGAVTSPNYNGHHCAVTAECLGPNNGISTDDGTCSTGPACTGDVAATNLNNAQGSCARWVGRPYTFYEFQGPPQALPYRASRLQCTPAYWDWKSEPGGLVTVVGAEIVPSSEYSVQAYASTCLGAEVGCANVSAPVTMYTRRKGDLVATYQTPSPSTLTQADAIDVSQSVDAVKHVLGAPVHVRAQMQPNLPDLNGEVNVLDIAEVVDSLKRTGYAFPGPCPCPSAVTCGGSCTGCAGMCVRVCAGGDNVGEPCAKNLDCGAGGVCAAAGTCRDKCGRCSP